MDDLLTKLRQKIGAPHCEINKQREAAAEEIARLTAEVVKWKARPGNTGRAVRRATTSGTRISA